MSILDGIVTVEDIYNCCRDTAFEIIHFASDSGPEGVELSGGVLLIAEEIAQIARLNETTCIVFNSCLSSRLAAYVVCHGVRYAVHTNVKLKDSDAWKLMVGFYDFLRKSGSKGIVSAFLMANSGDGEYFLGISPEYVQGLQISIERMALPVADRISPVTRVDLVKYGLIFLVLSGALTALINLISGGA